MSSTTDTEQRFAYLLSPEFEIVNTAGKPLTCGWIEVYLHGTRNKYYCFSDFDGTLHPFQIPLDSLGSNIILASPLHAYDVYIYNKFGSLVMSRYNIVPATNSADAIADVIVIDSPSETINVVVDGGTNWHLEVNTDLIATASGLDAVSGELANKKDKQEAKLFEGSATKTVKKITQNADGVMTVEFEDIDLPPEVPNVDITSPNGTIDVQSSTDVQTNTKTFTIDVNKGGVDYYIGSKTTVEVGTTNYNIVNNLVRADGNLDITHPGKGLYLVCVNANVRPTGIRNEQHEVWLAVGPNNTYTMMHSLDWSNPQDTDISCASILKINSNEPISIYLAYGTTPSIGVDLTVENVSVYRLDAVLGQGGGPRYAPGYGIEIDNDVISVATGDVVTHNYFDTIINSVSGDIVNLNETVDNLIGATGDYATVEYVDNRIATAAGDVYEAGQYISIQNDTIAATGLQPAGNYLTLADLNGYATEQYVDDAVAAVTGQPIAQVNSDWLATSGVAEILNKPDVFQLIAGDNIDITASGNDLVISASSDITKAYVDEQIDAATGMIPTLPQEEEVEFEELDLTNYALASAIPDISNLATKTELAAVEAEIPDISNLATKAEVQAATGMIPDVSNFATNDDVQYVQEQVDQLVAATGDYLQASDLDGYTTEQELQAATGMIPDVSNLATKSELAAVEAEIPTLPSEEEVEFEELNLSDYALASAIPDISNLATKSELAAVEAEIPDISDLATKAEVQAATGMIPDISDLATKAELSAVEAEIPDINNLATKTELNAVDAKVDAVSAEIPTLPSEEEVEFEELNLSDYALASAIPDVSNLATKADVQAATGMIPDVSNLATKSELSAVEAEIPEVDNLATRAELQAVADSIPDVSNFATKSELEAVEAEIPDISNLATKTEVQTVDAKIDAVSAAIPSEEEVEFEELDLSDYALASAIPDVSNLATKSEVQAATGMIPDISNLATKSELAAVEAEIPDISNLATKTYVDESIAAIPALSGTDGVTVEDNVVSLDNPVNLVAGSNVNIAVSGNDVIISSTGGGSGSTYTAGSGIDITNDTISVDNTVALKSEIPTLPSEEEITLKELNLADYALASAIPDVSTFATKTELAAATGMIPDTSDMATQTWVEQQGYLTSVPSTYATKSYVDTEVATKQNTLTGITDVQVVQALPASPVATVLYLIPEA